MKTVMKHLNKKYLSLLPVVLVLGGALYLYMQSDEDVDTPDSIYEAVSVDNQANVDVTHIHTNELFVDGALASDVTFSDCILDGDNQSECMNIEVHAIPTIRDTGPFCPESISTESSDAGIWLDGESVYDLDGEFISNLATIYDDSNWKLYEDDGSVRITETEEAFDAAARPDVDPEYQNYCVEGKAEWVEDTTTVYQIPSHPTYTGIAKDTSITDKIGITFDGVIIDPAAPVDAILSAYTIAAFDDCGGHYNPVAGYHMHAATGCGELDSYTDDESSLFGVAMDGFPIYSPFKNGEEPDDLDAVSYTHLTLPTIA